MTTGVVCEELGGKCQPVALDGLYELDLSHPTITDLCHMWTYGHGIRAAFTQHQSIKCVFADRLMTPTRHLGHFQPIEVNQLTELPHFYDDGLDLQCSLYRIQAIVCHTGSSLAGRFRAVLKGSEGWYICQDNEVPQFTEHLPDWCLERTVLFWMLPTIAALPPEATDQIPDRSDSDHVSDQGDSTKVCPSIPTQVLTQDWTNEQPLHADDGDPAAEDAAPPCSGALSLVLRTVLDDSAGRCLYG